jgi:hypothetical protein
MRSPVAVSRVAPRRSALRGGDQCPQPHRVVCGGGEGHRLAVAMPQFMEEAEGLQPAQDLARRASVSMTDHIPGCRVVRPSIAL